MIIDGVEILGVSEPIPGMEVTWQSIFKRLSTVIKSRTIGVRKAADFIAPYALASSAAGLAVVGAAVAIKSQEDAKTAGESGQKFIEKIKLLGLTPEQERTIIDELDKSLPKEDELDKTPDEPTTCPVQVEWYKQPAIWVVSGLSLAIIGTLIYFIVKGRKK